MISTILAAAHRSPCRRRERAVKVFVAAGIAAPEIGGPATYLEGLLPELRDRGHQVRVLAYGDRQPGDDSYGLTRVRRGPLPPRLARYAAASARRARWADVVLVLSLGLPRPSRFRAPVVLRVPGDPAWERAVNRGWIEPQEDPEEFQGRRHGWRVEAFKAWRCRETCRADRVVVPSDYLRGLVLGWGADPLRHEIIPNAVRVDAAAVSRLEARRRLGWAADGRYLVAAARLTRGKGIDLAIDAVAEVEGVQLVVAGDGPERAALAALAARRGAATTFCGTLPRADLALRLQAADYVLVYSAYEGLSHTLLEALALGTPVIASRRGGNAEVVRDGVNGLLVPHPDAAALAAALHDAFAPGVQQRLEGGTAVGLERFEWHRFVERTVATLEVVAADRRAETARARPQGRP
jgi:glycosyltransferase involved in cell wall biosynthesis